MGASQIVSREDEAACSRLLQSVAPCAEAIFLHAGWRSCGTWLWQQMRAQPHVRAYYEPFHEGLATLDQPAIAAFRPDSWGSGHGAGNPYFAEFGQHLNTNGRGVALYRKRFAFDNYFMPADQNDPELHAYLSALITSSHNGNCLPVLKFCRSLGRAAWMQQHFPNALQLVVLRDPVAQFRSARRQLEQDANRYFVLAPFVILARNRDHKLLADALHQLDVPMPPRLVGSLETTMTACWRHVQRLNWADRYRGFLALWAASAVAALAADITLIDADALLHDTAHRDAVRAILSRATGADTDLRPLAGPDATPAWPTSDADAQDAARAALAALAFVAAQRDILPAAQTRALTRKLAPRVTPGGASPIAATNSALPSLPHRRQLPHTVRYLDAALYVALSRAIYPLRRAHYHAARWAGRV